MSQDVAARLGALSQDHREGRLSLSAYRSLRAPLLDMLVTPEPAAGAEPTVTRELVPKSEVAPAAMDSDPATTTRPRHRLPLAAAARTEAHAPARAGAQAHISETATAEQAGLITPADSLVEASALAHRNMQAAARAEYRSDTARGRRLHPMGIGLALFVAAAALLAAWMMRSAREPAPQMAVTTPPSKADSKTTSPAARPALTPMPPPLPSDAKRRLTPSPSALAATDAAGCELQVGSATALTTQCRDQLSATEFGPRMLMLAAGPDAHGLAFAISARPVSQAQFRTFCQRTLRPYPRQPWSADDDPVVNVTWDEAREYLAWLSATTGKRYRLPTEADWLYFASQGKIETRWRAGNVREWMQDAVDDRSSDAGGPPPDEDPVATTPSDAADTNDGDSQRVVRGVSYADPATELLTARRTRDAATRDALTGFRALREVP